MGICFKSTGVVKRCHSIMLIRAYQKNMINSRSFTSITNISVPVLEEYWLDEGR